MTVPLVEVHPGRITRIRLNRPEARNALSVALMEAVVAALAASAADPGCRVVILSGAGPDFCAGADVRELATGLDQAGHPLTSGDALEKVLTAVERHPRPVVGAVHGAAFGGGCQLVSACDLVVADEEARFAVPSAQLGVVIGARSVQRLVAAVGPKRAGALLLAGRTITGVEAVEWGLATMAVAGEALNAAAAELAERIAALAPRSVAASKLGLRAAAEGDPQSFSAFERAAAEAMASRDVREGLEALRERRPPVFEGR
jgi:enoyl-CoA hydratase/carnithine racemase